MDDQLAVGAGALHRYTKREEVPAPIPVLAPGEVGFIRSLSLQAMVDSDRDAWALIWERFRDQAGAPWRSVAIRPEDRAASFATGDLIRGAGCFAPRTGRGCEDIHPRWFGWLSEPLCCLPW